MIKIIFFFMHRHIVLLKINIFFNYFLNYYFCKRINYRVLSSAQRYSTFYINLAK